MRKLVIIAALVALIHPLRADAQVRPETIRGRVTTDSGGAVIGATVTATMAPDRTFQQATTDGAGRYTIHFAAGTGDYLVHVSALGYKAARKRLTRAAGDTALVADFAIAREVTKLAAVKVEAHKETPQRGSNEATTGSDERERDGIRAAIAPDQDGNLAAIANAIPGVTSRSDGMSVLGLSGSQSNTTLNGMAFAGASLPRDASAHVTVVTSIYDPSRGGFSGGQTSAELNSGSTFLRRSAHLTMDAPALQATGPVGDRLGQKYSALNASIGGSGELIEEKWYYNNSIQVSRRLADAASLLSVGGDALAAAGVSADSAARLLQLLTLARVPASNAAIPGNAISQTVSFASRFDHQPYKPGSQYEPSKETYNVTFFGNLGDDQAQAFSPTSTPTRGGRRTALFLGSQANYSRYFGDVLNDTRMALSRNSERGTPYLRLPGGSVLVSSTLSGGDAAQSGLTFGGNGALESDRSNWTWETINETKWYAKGSPHRLKLTLESRLDGYSSAAQQDLLGTFTFPSLDALAANQPSSFSRTLSAPSRSGGEWSGFVALGDYWRVTPSLQLLYGARLEGNRFTTALADNPLVASAFGQATTEAPNRLHVSPRLGFTWYFGHEGGGRGYRFSSIAQAPIMPTMMLRGGIGEFRNLLPASLLSDASAANGLPGGITRLACIGAATPIPQWSDYLADPATIPASCANGAPSSFTDAAPNVRLFDRSYDAPRSWRANAAFLRTAGPFSLSIDGVYSLNLNQPGIVDLNFAGVPKFTLAGEGNRPVFVAPSSIVATTGLVSPTDARANGAFGQVLSSRSDLRSTSRQLTVTLSPIDFGTYYYSLAYTLGDMRSQARGFDGTTFDSPTAIERAPGDYDTRHQVSASIGRTLPHGMNVSLYGRFSSGQPYTPRVSSDVNGDGFANDRAFIFQPDAVQDPQLAAGMRSLLASAPSQARDCLVAQLGRPAERNSCRGPWTASLNMRIGLINRFSFTSRQFEASLNVANPLGGLDQLLHGDNLQGWGGGAFPDPTLLTVKGFDPASQRYVYEVNPRFGSTVAARQLARVPFRITVDMRFDLGLPLEMQQAVKLLKPGRGGNHGHRLPSDSIAMRLKAQVPDPYTFLLQESDSLLLSREQVEALTAAQAKFSVRRDSAWKVVGDQLAAMGDDFDRSAAMYLIDDATDRAWLLSRDEIPTIQKILSPIQLRLAPWVIGSLIQSLGKEKVGIRMFSF